MDSSKTSEVAKWKTAVTKKSVSKIGTVEWKKNDNDDIKTPKTLKTPKTPAIEEPVDKMKKRKNPYNPSSNAKKRKGKRDRVPSYPSPSENKMCLDADEILISAMNLRSSVGALSDEMKAAREHYAVEMFSKRKQWDQGPRDHRQARVGALFGFAHTAEGADKLEIFRIVALENEHSRHDTWNEDVPEHSDRGVVILSEYIGWMTTTSFVETAGADGGPGSDRGDGKLFIRPNKVFNWNRENEVFVS